MAKATTPKGGKPSPTGHEQRAAEAASPDPGTTQVREIKLPPARSERDFEAVAKLITQDPPAWLAEHLDQWVWSLALDGGVQSTLPTRAEMRNTLARVNDATSLLLRALQAPAVLDFLEPPDTGPVPRGILQRQLFDLGNRAAKALRSPALVRPDGKTKTGRGRALPGWGTSPYVFCAMLIAEAWKHFHGEYPGSRNLNAAQAAEEYWRLAGCERQSWSDNPPNAWRPHFERAESANQDELRAEIQRRLHSAEAYARDFESEPHTQHGM